LNALAVFNNLAQKRWRKINYHKRAELLHEAARKMRATRSLVGEMLTRETGKPFKESVDEVIWSSTATDWIPSAILNFR
jgi:acyl-CoA reductase-like NAD-dependent aldehyde dehydrogenase